MRELSRPAWSSKAEHALVAHRIQGPQPIEIGISATACRDTFQPAVLGIRNESFRLAQDAGAIRRTFGVPGPIDAGIGFTPFEAIAGELATVIAAPLGGRRIDPSEKQENSEDGRQ